MSNRAIESLWRKYLRKYAEPRIRDELQAHWASDPNVLAERIQFLYPPTFQPGYIGNGFFDSTTRIVFIGYNPGEGKAPSSREHDNLLAQELHAFAQSSVSLEQFCAFHARHLVRWPIYREKGIFSGTGEASIALLPEIVRPSVESVALLNLFPFKTTGNKPPLAGYGGSTTSLKTHMWECFVKPTIEELAPRLVVRYPDSDQYLPQLQSLRSAPRLIRVWHPSDYNLNAQRAKLAESWKSLANELAASQ